MTQSPDRSDTPISHDCLDIAFFAPHGPPPGMGLICSKCDFVHFTLDLQGNRVAGPGYPPDWPPNWPPMNWELDSFPRERSVTGLLAWLDFLLWPHSFLAISELQSRQAGRWAVVGEVNATAAVRDTNRLLDDLRALGYPEVNDLPCLATGRKYSSEEARDVLDPIRRHLRADGQPAHPDNTLLSRSGSEPSRDAAAAKGLPGECIAPGTFRYNRSTVTLTPVPFAVLRYMHRSRSKAGEGITEDRLLADLFDNSSENLKSSICRANKALRKVAYPLLLSRQQCRGCEPCILWKHTEVEDHSNATDQV